MFSIDFGFGIISEFRKFSVTYAFLVDLAAADGSCIVVFRESE